MKAPGVSEFFSTGRDVFMSSLPGIVEQGKEAIEDLAVRKAPEPAANLARSAARLVTGGVSNIGNNAKDLLVGGLDYGVGAAFDKLGKSKRGRRIVDFAGRIFGKQGPVTDYQKMIARADPVLTFEFDVDMPDVSPFMEMPGYKAIPSEYIEDIDIPFDSLESGTDVYVNCRKLNLPGKISASEFTIKFYAEHKVLAMRYIDAWRASAVTPKGVYNLPYKLDGNGYKKYIVVSFKNGGDVAFQMVIYGVFPTTRPPVTLQSATSDRWVMEQTFSCNGVYPIYDPTISSPQSPPQSKSIFDLAGGAILKSVRKRL